MSWTKTSWADLIGTNASKTTITAGNDSSGNIDCNGSNPFMLVAVKVVVVFGASPDDNVTVEAFGYDADGAAEVDTLPMFVTEIPEVTSSEERATYQIDVSALDQLQIVITNNDSADSIDVWVSYMGAYI